jgi:glyoxylase-like metal-dependent hydrolase (beta-lactamase superfamily II)
LDWFEVTQIDHGTWAIGEPRHGEDVKSYLVEGEHSVAVIDTGLGVGDFAGLVRQLSDREPLVVQTHGHWDHIGASCAFERVLVHPSEAYALRRGFPNEMYRRLFEGDRDLPEGFDPETAFIPSCEPSGELHDGDRIDLGGRVLQVLHTPGHSPGGVALLDRERRLLFPGDSFNLGSMWVFLPRSEPADHRATLRRLAELAPELDAVYPSHGPYPVPPDTLVEAHEACEAIWAGRKPDRQIPWDIGFPEPVATDVFEFGQFTFLMPAGRYG